MKQGDRGDHEELFTERCGWSILLWLFLVFMATSLALAAWAALGNTWGLATLLVQLPIMLLLQHRSRLLVRVNAQWLYVGDAKIERQYITSVVPLSKEALRKKLGQEADPAAYLATRLWIHTGVVIDINDPQDFTPYWIVSSKKTKLLTEALSLHSRQD
jgi:hypothetical protein